MFDWFNNTKISERKENFAVLLVFLAGFIFLTGEIFGAKNWIELLYSFKKITVQSNFLSLIFSGLYLFKPELSIFRNNLVFVFVGTILLTAGIGYLFILFPIYLTNSDQFLIEHQNITSYQTIIWTFYALWNHVIIQILFLNMIKQIFSQGHKWKLFPACYKKCAWTLYQYWIFIIFFYVFLSFNDSVFPAYGMLTNLNWNTKFKTMFGEKLYDLKAQLSALLLTAFISYCNMVFIWWMSFKLNPVTSKENQLNL